MLSESLNQVKPIILVKQNKKRLRLVNMVLFLTNKTPSQQRRQDQKKDRAIATLTPFFLCSVRTFYSILCLSLRSDHENFILTRTLNWFLIIFMSVKIRSIGFFLIVQVNYQPTMDSIQTWNPEK